MKNIACLATSAFFLETKLLVYNVLSHQLLKSHGQLSYKIKKYRTLQLKVKVLSFVRNHIFCNFQICEFRQKCLTPKRGKNDWMDRRSSTLIVGFYYEEDITHTPGNFQWLDTHTHLENFR